jgi:chromosome segregation ATPase
MNEEPTKDLPNRKSFEERVFARFDAFDARFNTVDARFDAFDARFNTVDARFDAVDARLEKLESRAYDTKPIWERALAAIMELGLEMGEVKSKVGAIEGKVDVIEGKVQLLENEVGAMKTGIRNELVDVRRELKHHVSERLDLILKFLLEDREDIRDAEARIRELESKFA